MILNEDYFNDLEIEDKDVIEDVDELDYELTLDDVQKLPEQYSHLIRFEIENADDNRNTTFIQTSLIPKLFKRLDTIFELYGIEHYEYVLASRHDVKICETVVKFGDYQLFCEEDKKDKFINNTYDCFFINVFVNYPEFTYKKAFRFLYTMLNLYKNSKLINRMSFNLNTTNDYFIELEFRTENNHIKFYQYNTYTCGYDAIMYLCNELTEENKRVFYFSVFYHFFGEGVSAPYKLIDRDVSLKPIRPR